VPLALPCPCAAVPFSFALPQRLLGLTATPFRLDPSEPLSAVFGTCARGPSIAALVKRRVLVPPVTFGEMCPCDQKVGLSHHASGNEGEKQYDTTGDTVCFACALTSP